MSGNHVQDSTTSGHFTFLVQPSTWPWTRKENSGMLFIDLINSPANQRSRRGNRPEEDSTSFSLSTWNDGDNHNVRASFPEMSSLPRSTKQQNEGVLPTTVFGRIVGECVNASILQGPCINYILFTNNILRNFWYQFNIIIVWIIAPSPPSSSQSPGSGGSTGGGTWKLLDTGKMGGMFWAGKQFAAFRLSTWSRRLDKD